MKISMASDHAGVEMKAIIKEYIESLGHQVEDMGPFSHTSVDYPDYAKLVCQNVNAKKADLGICVCGTGIGMSIACNKIKGIRAALCSDTVSAKFTRLHNDANVLCMGARIIGIELAKAIVDEFLSTNFEGGRHQQRINKLED